MVSASCRMTFSHQFVIPAYLIQAHNPSWATKLLRISFSCKYAYFPLICVMFDCLELAGIWLMNKSSFFFSFNQLIYLFLNGRQKPCSSSSKRAPQNEPTTFEAAETSYIIPKRIGVPHRRLLLAHLFLEHVQLRLHFLTTFMAPIFSGNTTTTFKMNEWMNECLQGCSWLAS